MKTVVGQWSMFAAVVSIGVAVAPNGRADEGFVKAFNGKDLSGWRQVERHGEGYRVAGGILICPKGGGGRLFTEKTYSDFVLRFEFKLQPGGNNGVAIRSPLEGDPAYVGIEIQILDDYAPQYANLRPTQYHGSVYDLFPAKKGSLKPAGEWNSEEIHCQGRKIRVQLNGQIVVDANLDDIKDAEVLKKHPGISRTEGHIGFLGHGDHVEFRNIEIKDITKKQGTVTNGENGSSRKARFGRIGRRILRPKP